MPLFAGLAIFVPLLTRDRLKLAHLKFTPRRRAINLIASESFHHAH